MILTALIGYALLSGLIMWFFWLIVGYLDSKPQYGFYSGIIFGVATFLLVLSIGLIGWV